MANKTTPSRKASFLSSTQIISLAIIIVLATSSLISPQDIAFVIFSIIYIYFLSIFAFPSPNPPQKPSVFDPKNKILPIYVLVGAIVGLFLPLIYILQGIFLDHNKEGVKAAAPHLFLLAAQVYMEGVVFSDKFAIPIHVFLPVFYNSKRVFSIVDWLMSEFPNLEDGDGDFYYPKVLVGRGLALANMAFWGFNLFGFLLPIYLPRAFSKYYSISKG